MLAVARVDRRTFWRSTLETTSINPLVADIIGIVALRRPRRAVACYVPIGHLQPRAVEGDADLLGKAHPFKATDDVELEPVPDQLASSPTCSTRLKPAARGPAAYCKIAHRT